MTRARLIASAGGIGFSPVAPGTVASLAALILGGAMLLAPAWVLPAAILAATLGGLWAIGRAGGADDPGWVVIDEVAGQWIALLALPRPSVAGLAAAFALFRFLDIAKPGPIGWADRQHGSAGVMADDLIAGALAAGVLWALREHWPLVFAFGMIP